MEASCTFFGAEEGPRPLQTCLRQLFQHNVFPREFSRGENRRVDYKGNTGKTLISDFKSEKNISQTKSEKNML
jgi:hypothetical protein